VGSHAPSGRPGACDPCQAGDHGGCDDLANADALDTCSCYAASWEDHETLGYDRDLGGVTQPLGNLMPGDGHA
jgi:hypothetical protein